MCNLNHDFMFIPLIRNLFDFSREVCHRTDKAETFLRADKGVDGITGGRAPQWAVTTCVAANHPDHQSLHHPVLPGNHHRSEELCRPQPLTGRRSSADNLPLKRY